MLLELLTYLIAGRAGNLLDFDFRMTPACSAFLVLSCLILFTNGFGFLTLYLLKVHLFPLFEDIKWPVALFVAVTSQSDNKVEFTTGMYLTLIQLLDAQQLADA